MTAGPAGRGPQIMAVFLLFLSLSTIATGLRIYCRAFVIRRLGLDDWLAVLAWVLFACHAAFAVNGVFHGTGQHAWDIHPQSEIAWALKSWWLCEPFYVLSNMAIKASIAMMLLRFLVETWHRIAIFVVLAIIELFSVAFFMVFIFQCWPSSYFWTRLMGAEGTCMNTSDVIGMVLAYSSIMCVGDWTFFLLPFWIVCKLQAVTANEKIMIGIILAMSSIASVATIVRIPYVHTMSSQTDFLYATTDVAIWSCAETGIAIVACSSATLRPLVRRLLEGGRFPDSNDAANSLPTSTSGIARRHSAYNIIDAISLSSRDEHEATDLGLNKSFESGFSANAHGVNISQHEIHFSEFASRADSKG